jgi:tRNA(Arg) A34 adenosine deaminase TadA
MSPRQRHEQSTAGSEHLDHPALSEHVREAVRLSREEVAAGGIPFIGLVVGNGRVLGTGANRVLQNRDPTAHAEITAMRAATAAHGPAATDGAVLIASGEPCAQCYLAAVRFGIGHVVHAADRTLAARHGFDYTGSYRSLPTDPADPDGGWPLTVTALPVEGAELPFTDYLARQRRFTS